MTIEGFCRPARDAWHRMLDECCRLYPCLSDPERRSSLGLKVALVMLHVAYGGILFLLDRDLIEKTTKEPWYTALYILLYLLTLTQYFFTSGSSPGYVIDAMRAFEEADLNFRKTSVTSKQPASSKDGSVVIAVEGDQLGTAIQGNGTSWAKLVLDLHHRGSSIRSWNCTYCRVLQPPRAKHCHDCDKCVLQFDHHCVWLGTCIGQGNHCRFWWYIFEETALCLWTGILYIMYLKANMLKAWWIDAIVLFLLATLSILLVLLMLLFIFHGYLILTNQTTYELVRRRRIPYLRGIPEKVNPFSKGICRNLYSFCCSWGQVYNMEPLPSLEEIEAKSRPYTCFDVMICRCC